MATTKIQGILFYFPSDDTVSRFVEAAREHVVQEHVAGVYRKAEDVDAIIKTELSFYQSKLDGLLKPLLSKSLLEMVLYQYDQYMQIYRKFNAGSLTETEARFWLTSLGPTYGRAVKFIAERIVLLENLDSNQFDKKIFEENCEGIFFCAFQIVTLSSLSDQTLYLIPHATEIVIHQEKDRPVTDLIIIDESLRRKVTEQFPKRWRWEVKNGNRVVKSYGKELSPELYVEKHGKFLDPIFKEQFGFTYQDAISVLTHLKDSCIPAPNWFPTTFIEKKRILENYDFAPEIVEKMLSAFTVSASNIKSEGRDYFNPKFEHRLGRRGIVEVRKNGDPYLCWSNSLFSECLIALLDGITYQSIPSELKNDATKAGLVEVSRDFGKWFEQQVKIEFKNLGISATCSRKSIGSGKDKIHFTPGEIDLLAYFQGERLLVIGECKRVKVSTDSKLYRDEMTDFVSGDKAFAKKLRNKTAFIHKNLKQVIKVLSTKQELNVEVRPKWIASVILTRRPTIASCFINDFQCVSLAEFVRDFHEKGTWPYNFHYALNREEVAARAYGLWKQNGSIHGDDLSHWFQAEDEVLI